MPQVRRRRRRDGLRRAGSGRQPGAPQGDLRARLPDPDRRGRLPGRGHHLRPELLRAGDRYRGARDLRDRLHRGLRLDQGEPSRGAHLRRYLERVVLVPGQQPRPRGDPRGVPVPRHQGRPGHGHRQRRCAGALRLDRPRAAGPDRGRRPEPSRGRGRKAPGNRGTVQQLGEGRRPGGSRVAQPPGPRADHARPGQGHRRPRRCRHRGIAGRDRRRRWSPDRGDRGPADGRHERRR